VSVAPPPTQSTAKATWTPLMAEYRSGPYQRKMIPTARRARPMSGVIRA